MKKILIAISIIFPLFVLAQFSGISGVSDFSPWRLSGTAIQPKISSWTLGSSGTPVGNGFFTNLTTSIMTISNSVTGNLTVNGGTISLGASPNTATTTIVANGSGQLTLSSSGTNQNIVLTPSGSGSVITSTLIGGIAVGSSLNLQSTSGIGTTDYIRFLVGNNGGTEAMRIINNGNVGIGTTSPVTKLSITGADNTTFGQLTLQSTAAVARLALINNTGTGFAYGAGSIGLTNASGAQGMIFDLNGTTYMTISGFPTVGNVGIGTTSPAGILSVQNSTGRSIWIDDKNTRPTLHFVNGVTTGILDMLNGGRFAMYTETGHSLTLGTNNADRLTIDSSGNLGIGTTSPAQLLAVAGTGYFTTGIGVGIASPTGGATIQADASGGGIIKVSRVGIGSGILQMEADGTNGTVTATNAMLFQTGGSERARITSAGNVGIGTTTPNWLLQAAGTRPFFTLSDTSAGLNAKHWFLASEGGNLYVGTSSDTFATTTYLTIANGGNIGIGTTSPSRLLSVSDDGTYSAYFSGRVGVSTSFPLDKLHVSGGGIRLDNNQHLWGTSTANVGMRLIGVDGSNNVQVGNISGIVGTTNLYSGAAITMTLMSDNNVGIGTTSPVAKLSVTGGDDTSFNQFTIQSTGATAGITLINSSGFSSNFGRGSIAMTNTSGAQGLAFGLNGTTYMTLSGYPTAGNVGIGTTSPMDKLSVVGNIAVTGCVRNAATGALVTGSPACVDIAEAYTAGEDLLPGDVVAVRADSRAPEGFNLIKATESSIVLGVVSTRPAVYLQGETAFFGGSHFSASSTFPFGSEVPLALAGRVPVKVSLESGPIHIGDRITSSSLAGYGMKATTSGMTVGIALENFDETTASTTTIVGNASSIMYKTGKILVFVNLGYAKLDDH